MDDGLDDDELIGAEPGNGYVPYTSQMAIPNRTARKALIGQMNAVRADDSITKIAGWQNYLQKMRELEE